MVIWTCHFTPDILCIDEAASLVMINDSFNHSIFCFPDLTLGCDAFNHQWSSLVFGKAIYMLPFPHYDVATWTYSLI